MNWLIVILFAILAWSNAKCAFHEPAIFNFGDSNSDTGSYYVVFPPQNPPNGITYFNKPTGRVSDGRLIIDFLAQGLGLPLLNPYLQSVGSDFRHGVNFAVSGAAVRRQPREGGNLFSLAVQFNQFKQFKLQVDERNSFERTPLPKSDIFGKSLYTIYIGQNDFAKNVTSFGAQAGMTDFLQQVVTEIANTTKEIYALGGRTFLVFNLAPLGCYPFILKASSNTSDIDSSGCLISCNNAVDAYNFMLKAALEQVRQQLPDAQIIHVDTHAVLLQIFNNPTAYGFQKATSACIVGGSFCGDPQNYIHWDGVHLTEAANKIVANAIFGGSYFDPPFSFSHYCKLE